MIEGAQEAEKASIPGQVVPGRKSRRPGRKRLRARQLTAIEIAEGALLADIAVVFQLLIKYLPIGGDVFRLLVPVVFVVIVLRRGLYVGCISLCVALFVVSITSGPAGTSPLLLETGAGLFLGATMKYRRGHLFTFVVGSFCGSLLLYTQILLSVLFVGPVALASLLRGLRQAYHLLTLFLQFLLPSLGLGAWWKTQVFPVLDRFMQWGFTNWWVLLYIGVCLLVMLAVIVVYSITNRLTRLLGYTVRPLPGPRMQAIFYWLARRVLAILPRRGRGEQRMIHLLRREVRRIGIARQRRRRRESET